MSEIPVIETADGAARRRLELSDERLRQARDEAAAAARTAFLQVAGKDGYCMACWDHSTDYGRHARLARRVKHREPANCPQARKTAAKAAR